MGEKSHLILLSLVSIVAIVGIVIMVLNFISVEENSVEISSGEVTYDVFDGGGNIIGYAVDDMVYFEEPSEITGAAIGKPLSCVPVRDLARYCPTATQCYLVPRGGTDEVTGGSQFS